MRRVQGVIWVVLLMFTLFTSCSTDEAVFTSSSDVMERIDMAIEGEDVEHFHLQSIESDASSDLIQFNYYGNPSSRFDIKLHLDDTRTLIFRLVNEVAVNPWEKEESYSVYPSQDIEDKQKYVTVELLDSGEVPAYSSTGDSGFPPGAILNAFQVVDFNPAANELLCRIVDLPLVSTTNTDDAILLNGTFNGAVTFLD